MVFETKNKATIFCPRAVLDVKDSHRGPHPWYKLVAKCALSFFLSCPLVSYPPPFIASVPLFFIPLKYPSRHGKHAVLTYYRERQRNGKIRGAFFSKSVKSERPGVLQKTTYLRSERRQYNSSRLMRCDSANELLVTVSVE